MTFSAEPTWGEAGAMPVEAYAAAPKALAPAVTNVDGAEQSSIKDLESEVYTVRDVHGDDRVKLRRKLARARSSMTDASYRRALELARDSVLLTIEECLEGAQAMEWEPLPRPEFTLASIEAAVAEQERAEQEGTKQKSAEHAPEAQERVEREAVAQVTAEQVSAEQQLAEQEPVEQERVEPEAAAPAPAEQPPAEPEREAVDQTPAEPERDVVDQAPAEQEGDVAETPAEQAPAERAAAEQEQTEREPSGTSRKAG